MGNFLFDYCIENNRQDLLDAWDSERNAGLSMHDVTFGSSKLAWWRCERGHSWQASVRNRTSKKQGCPYCSGHSVLQGFNDLATYSPGLAAEWHTAKNKNLTPLDVSYGSHRKVWWHCDLGHEWEASVKSRVGGHDCPFCGHRKVLAGFNDLATTDPLVANEWHPTKNHSLKPSDVFAGSTRKVFWRCSHNHTWQATIASRVRGSGCPVCAGKTVVKGLNDLASTFPYIAGQWDHDLNGILLPEHVTPFSNRKVWWRCESGHSYASVISSRTGDGSGCPYCSGRRVLTGFNDLKTKYPLVAAQWHEKMNGNLTPDQVTSGSKKKVWWKCNAGHIWKAPIYSRTGGHTGCPVCADVKTSPYYYANPQELERKVLSALEIDI